MRTNFIKAISSSFFIIQAVTALYGSPASGGNGTFPMLVNNEGTPVADVKLVINLEKYLASATKNPFEDFNETLAKRDDSTDLDSEDDANSSDDWLEVYTYNFEYASLSGYDTTSALEKRKDIHECTTWVKGVRECVNQIWGGLVDVWNISYKIRQLNNAQRFMGNKVVCTTDIGLVVVIVVLLLSRKQSLVQFMPPLRRLMENGLVTFTVSL